MDDRRPVGAYSLAFPTPVLVESTKALLQDAQNLSIAFFPDSFDFLHEKP